MNQTWSDSIDWLRVTIVYLGCIVALLLGIFVKNESIVFNFIICMIGAYGLYAQIRRISPSICDEGIRMGNIVHNADRKLLLKQKPQFFNWKDIEYMKIISKEEIGTVGSGLFDFVILKSKVKRRYECLVNNAQGFIDTLKQMNKAKLIKKDSKYLR